MFRETATATEVPATRDLITTIINADYWVPTSAEDFRPLLLGNRRVLAADFGELLFALSLLPAGSMRALNVVGYASGPETMQFEREFVFIQSPEMLTEWSEEAEGLAALTLQKLLSLTSDVAITTSNGNVKLADVRKAFAVDGEVRVFNLGNHLSPEFVQAMANVFQVRATGLVKKPATSLRRSSAWMITTIRSSQKRSASRAPMPRSASTSS